MKARNKAAHQEAVDMMKRISEAINTPGRDKVKTLLKVLGYIQREYKKPLFTDSKMFPNINPQYLTRMADAAAIDIDSIIKSIPTIDNPRKIIKKISITNDPYLVISNFLKSNMLPVNAIDDDTLNLWAVVTSSNIDGNLTKIKNLLDSIIGRNNREIIKDVSKYIGIIVVIFGTILMNYIICMIGLGLIAVDITLDEYMKESTEDSVLSMKDYPYIISGTFPLIHVDREMEYRDIGEQDNESFAANNLSTLIRKVGKYIDSNVLDMVGRNSIEHLEEKFSCPILDSLVMAFGTPPSINIDNEYFIYTIKEKILEISTNIIDHDFKYPLTKRFQWCKEFLSAIDVSVNSIRYLEMNSGKMINVGILVQMTEILCLQIWDAFIKQNHVRKIVPIENQYITLTATEDTFGVIQYYNTLQPLNLVPSVSNSQLLVNNILESIGSNTTILTEAQEPIPGKEMDQTMAEFRKTFASAKGYLDQFKNKALPWIKSNDFSSVSAEIKMYSYNPKNVASGVNLLNDITNALTVGYSDKRSQGSSNINDIIIKNFPSLANMNQNSPIPADKLENLISTGNPDEKIKEEKITGDRLLQTYKTLSEYIKSPDVLNFMGSDAVDKVSSAIGAFKVNAGRIARQPMKESISDDIVSMMEADVPNNNPNNAPTIQQPDSNLQQPQQPAQQNQQTQQQTGLNSQPNVKSNASEINDAKYLRHAVTIASAVINTLTSMTLSAYTLCSGFYSAMNSKSTAKK